MEHEGDDNTNCDWYFWYSHQRIIERLEDDEDHPDSSITENGQNTEKGPGDVKRLAVTQTSMKSFQIIIIIIMIITYNLYTVIWFQVLQAIIQFQVTNNNNNPL